ncbi:MAG: tyrosine-type recombinase/integrase [Euryarchaeota archaeon]|nr:tyrosine-type recombinase/integrase [Euryarchaeota archaeon]
MPTGQRWWIERVKEWTDDISGITPQSRRTYREHVGALPRHFERLGFEPPTNPHAVSKAMIESYAHDDTLAPTTRAMDLGLLRQFLDHEKIELARDGPLWKKPKRVARRRFWLPKEELFALLAAARGRERLVVALAGFNGLRSHEIRSLRASDCRLSTQDPSIYFVGKGDRPRDIAISEVALVELRAKVGGKSPSALVYPYGRTTIDRDLKNACRRAKLRPYSCHDLRRTFGRLARDAGVDLATIQSVYGHEDISLTAYYIGDDRAAMRRGMDTFSAFVKRGTVPPAEGPAGELSG